MTPLVVAAVLLAAVTHASWNAIAHGIRDQLLAFTLVGGGGTLCGALLACFTPLPAAAAWPYLLGSAVLHILYQGLLMQSFRMGDFGQMYPIARGTAPLVVTVLAALFVHEIPSGWALAGVALASAGLVGLAVWGIRGSGARPHWPAIAAAVATGLSIASYTTVDGLGVRASETSLGYIGWLMLLEGLAIPVYALITRRGRLVAELRPFALRGLAGGVLSVFAYGLVLWAQTRAPLAPIAALRESSIIVGAAIGTVFFKERFGLPRLAAAGLMVAGIGLMLAG
ncbi:DMT family transporter [Streptomyces noursei]|uniref:Membrane protein n=1 Tax=Streptomyces noursei TaxID=1971 RepID=A0A401R1Z8_STRNR|nr:DMT family transporter [Streptomyces noursei]AKA04332.1 membrane protein [Streptomyces noursei ZPM]EOT05827.1 membrane protein [Streptomyces noursei CCRC 11814]EXU90773.1 membrane protein [Streptomyces noursei PD-1]UWS72721.1 DMT family transporter [Streptomyces noursei]GCB91678.1 membrane protein [Streptomyces noursei]